MSEGVAFCTICFEAILNEGNGGCLKCGHVLHLDCLNLALKSGTDGRRCPICRQLSNRPPIRLFFDDLHSHSSPGASASPSRAKSSQDPSGNALALKQIHQLELDISATKSAHEHANKVAQKALSANVEIERQVRKLSDERNGFLADKDKRIRSMNRLSDAYAGSLERVMALEGQVQRATKSLRDAQDEHSNFEATKQIYETQLRRTKAKAKADLEAKDQTIQRLESLLAVAQSSLNRRPLMRHDTRDPENFHDADDYDTTSWDTSGAAQSQAPDSPWSMSYGRTLMGRSSPGRSSRIRRTGSSSSLELDPSMFVTQQDPTEFGPPPSKRLKGGPDSPSEVAGIKVRQGKAIGAVATGPIRSRKLSSGM